MGGTEGHFPGSTIPCTITEYRIKRSDKAMSRVEKELKQNDIIHLISYLCSVEGYFVDDCLGKVSPITRKDLDV